MGRRARIVVLAVVGVAVVLVAGGYAVLALTGDDAPPPPRLQGTPAQEGAAPAGAGRWHPVAPAGSFVGYRVDERYLGVGVRTAVGRTSAVTGSVTVDGDRVEGADLRADMTTVHSDQARRDDALRSRAIETDRYPSARFTLAGPVACRRQAAAGQGHADAARPSAPRSRSPCAGSGCPATAWSWSAARRSASRPSPSSRRAWPASSR